MSLILLNTQTNDAKVLYLTDASTWGLGDPALPAYTAVSSASLSIYYKTPDYPDGTTPVTIDIISVFNAALSASDLIFPIVMGSVPALDADAVGINEFADGIYIISYTVSDGVSTWTFDSALELLVDGVIKVEIYRQLGQIPLKYVASNNYYTKPMDDILLLKCLHYSMEADAYVAKKEQLLETLDTLQRLTE